jgi:molecular chaperone HscA
MAAGAARIRVTFQVDADGLLAVSARETTSGVEASVSVKPAYGLHDDDITRMLAESMGAAETDMQARALRELQVEAKRLLEATQAALAADRDLLDEAEFARVAQLMSELVAHAGGGDVTRLKEAIDRLAHGTEEFAARRMDRSIRAALAGRRVDDVLARQDSL